LKQYKSFGAVKDLLKDTSKKLHFDKVKTEVGRLLEDFDKEFNSSKVYELRNKYPRYVALYTKFIYQPEVAVRGINPSYFSCRKYEEEKFNIHEEERRVLSLKGLHDINAYTLYSEPLYHHYLVKDFKEIKNMEYIQNNLMGWNNCFIQSGGQNGMGDLMSDVNKIDKKNNNKNALNLINLSIEIAQSLDYLIQPKILIYAGKPAAEVSGFWGQKKSLRHMNDRTVSTAWGGRAIAVQHFSYPESNKQESYRKSKIENLLNKIDYVE